MKQFLFISALFFILISAFAQKDINNNSPLRSITDNGLNGVEVSYHFQQPNNIILYDNKIEYSRLFVEGFSHLQEVGLPALPSHIDLVALPEGATYELKVFDKMPEVLSTKRIYPALKPARDTEGAPEPEFEINEEFYSTNQIYPNQTVKIIGSMKFRGIEFLMVQTCPIQYNPSNNKLYLHSNINYRIEFSGANSFTNYRNHTESYIKQLLNYPLNSQYWKKESDRYYKSAAMVQPTANSKNYIIITDSSYAEAADSMANWKRQMGYSVEVVSSANWTAATVKQAVHSRYSSWIPKPDYLLIIGDHQDVPAEIYVNSSNDQYGTDLYYVCMDGNNDYVPDMAKGRISADNAASALMQVKKIIDYERNPISDTSFYQNALNCAQYQDDDNDGYADRRFLHTSEDIRSYFLTQGYDSQRIYYCDQIVTPTNYNNGYYSNAQALDTVLLKSNGFAWNGGSTEIKNAINNGKFLVFHRDHGYAGGGGWAHPYFVNNKINTLTNGDKLPVVFSINCHTGEFTLPQCFAETFMRKINAGAVGVIAASYYSYSGYNDGLSEGMIDAIWSNPGLVPQFGSGGINSPNVNTHSDIVKMGDVVNQGLVRMVQTWGGNSSGNRYTYALFHYFGDPAMRIWTQMPENITATFADTISCTDTSIAIYNCSDTTAVVSVMGNGVLLGRTSLNGANANVTLNSIQGAYLTITITARNKIPLISRVYLSGGSGLSLFRSAVVNKCKNDSLGSIQLFPACGVAPYSVLWSTGDTTLNIGNLAAGIYTVEVTDAVNNTINDTIVITEPSTVLNIASDVENAKCYFQASGNISLNVTGGVAPYSYLWGNSFTGSHIINLSAGNYTVKITDSIGCIINKSFVITEPTPLDMTLTQIDDINNDCSGTATCYPTGGTLPYTYQWNDAASQTTQTAIDLCKGMYKIILKDSNNCISYRTLFISNTVGIDILDEENDIKVYPNPINNGIFTIEINDEKSTSINIEIYNSLGKIIEKRELDVNNRIKEKFDISMYASGIYYLKIQYEDKATKVFKLILE